MPLLGALFLSKNLLAFFMMNDLVESNEIPDIPVIRFMETLLYESDIFSGSITTLFFAVFDTFSFVELIMARVNHSS